MIKKYNPKSWIIFSFLIIYIFAVTISCQKKNKDDLDENMIAVKFKIKDFETFVKPLDGTVGLRKVAAVDAAINTQEEVLFKWDFDKSNTTPNVAFNADPIIDYNNANTDFSFVAGWPTDGKAISIRAAQMVFIKVKTANIIALGKINMDVNSSNTGPRAFLLDYSRNLGQSYTRLGDTIKYPITLSTNSSVKMSIQESLADINLSNTSDLWIRITLLEGQRPQNSNYNMATGAFKMDNLQVSGLINEASGQHKFYYHIFNAATDSLVKKGSLSAQENFEVDLPPGRYYFSLLSKNSNRSLLFNNENYDRNFAIQNPFSEKDAEIFAARDTFQLSQTLERNITLNRIYSEIKVEFTDPVDLSYIDSILIKQLHNDFYYYPFSSNNVLTTDPSILRIIPAFTDSNKTFFFNQFMGFSTSNRPLRYQLQVYDQNVLIRDFELSSEIRQNIQLLFRGRLLNNFNPSQGFNIIKNEQWNGKFDVGF